jgi:hypothetical protein
LVLNKFLDLEVVFFSHEAWFTLNGNVNSQNNIYWCSENLHAVHEVCFCDLKVGAWCAVSAHKLKGPMFFEEMINSDHYIQ